MSSETKNEIVNLGRRRLAKGGLAGSVILATFASKNALAAAPYQCTMSGLLSGNPSPKGPATKDSCELGPTANDLKGDGAWIGVDKTAFFSTVFNDVYDKLTIGEEGSPVTELVKKGATEVAVPATLEDVINLPPSTSFPPPNVELGRAAIAVYVGWAQNELGLNYPLTNAQIKAMFNDTIGGATHTLKSSLGDVNLDDAEVLRYFNYLTTGVAPLPEIIR